MATASADALGRHGMWQRSMRYESPTRLTRALKRKRGAERCVAFVRSGIGTGGRVCSPQSRRRCGAGGAPVLWQMRAWGEPSPGADVGGAGQVLLQMRAGVSPVPTQMRDGGSPFPVQTWPGGEPTESTVFTEIT